ncbi:sensor histidine kinase [Candidatus Magnetominusculus xianensis]|uniref:histidine kinase n=1 Tax=Candidatus Magnetominusculus xianensis TaxID=1748249 RepID=A0ABR5SES5_9BACT|nr:ATP-binding protein [Candidatus Magnetominusculus xianensis]KWT82931.1 PAS domain-containing sensor histidine kinase [Candidatus Magnetominusculus xianensis]MBF0403010.1 HAMP domain-containing protein [Nitrospirota bacterium]
MTRESIAKRVLLPGLVVIAVVAAGFTVHETFINPQGDITHRLIFAALFNITLLALLTLAFFVSRNLLRLYFEKKNRITGYKFKTKLVTIFVGITLLPSAMLFIISSGLVTNYIDKWFTPTVSKPIDDAKDLATYTYDMIRKNTFEDAIAISKGATPAPRYKTAKFDRTKEDVSETIKDAFKGKPGIEVFVYNEADIVTAVIPLNKNGRIDEVLLVSTVAPIEITRKVGEIQKAHQSYVTLHEFKAPLKGNYLLILGFFTLLVVFLALWIALRISRGITEPIQNLLKATADVSGGNFNIYVKPNADDEIGMLIKSFNVMITKVKQTELSLQSAYIESDRRRLFMENIIYNINSGVIYLDAENKVITINDAACAVLGVEAEDVLNKPYTEVIKNVVSAEFEMFVRGINLYNFYSKKEQLKVSINGRNMVLRVFIIQLKDNAKNPVGVLVVFDDLTELILAEKALAWQDVAKRLTHEIKNPLTPIKLSAERLLKRWRRADVRFSEVIEKSTATIIREVDGLQRLVNEFSKLGTMPDIEPSLTDLQGLVNEVLDLYSEYEHIDIVFEYKTKITTINIDGEHFKRMLINILDNAIQAIEENGKIGVTVAEDETASNIIIDISDNGVGIDEKDREKLFQPYFSRRKNGTGLGLAIAHRIVTEHKGTITVSNNALRGSTFRITIPVTKKSLRNQARKQELAQGISGGGR